jgi:hypothetical protein
MVVAHVIHHITVQGPAATLHQCPMCVIAQSHFCLVPLDLRALIRLLGMIMECKLGGIHIAQIHYMPAEIRVSAPTHPPRGRTGGDRSGGEGGNTRAG